MMVLVRKDEKKASTNQGICYHEVRLQRLLASRTIETTEDKLPLRTEVELKRLVEDWWRYNLRLARTGLPSAARRTGRCPRRSGWKTVCHQPSPERKWCHGVVYQSKAKPATSPRKRVYSRLTTAENHAKRMSSQGQMKRSESPKLMERPVGGIRQNGRRMLEACSLSQIQPV